jgi:uncharacterized protein
MRAIADTGFVVAFINRTDGHHAWAREIGKSTSEPFLTCEAVLAESIFQVQSADQVLGLLRTGFLRSAFQLSEHVDEVQAMAERYRDRQPDLADLCLIRMSEIYETLPLITVDEKDFRVYRRNGRDVIPIICPPRTSRS